MLIEGKTYHILINFLKTIVALIVKIERKRQRLLLLLQPLQQRLLQAQKGMMIYQVKIMIFYKYCVLRDFSITFLFIILRSK